MIRLFHLSDILGHAGAVKILEFFIGQPSREAYRAEITKKTKLAKATVGKWLTKLTKAEMLEKTHRANLPLYSLNTASPVVKQLRILFSVAELAPIFKNFPGEVSLYGSAARGENDENSDMDLLVISNEPKKKVFGEFNKAAKRSKKHLTVKVFNSIEYAQMARKDKAFYERINKDGIRIA